MYQVPPTVPAWQKSHWQCWVTDHLRAGATGSILLTPFVVFLTTPFESGTVKILVTLGLFFVCMGVCIGYYQRVLPSHVGINDDLWAWVTTLGACFGLLIVLVSVGSGRMSGLTLDQPTHLILWSTMFGTGAGITQWGLLRPKVQRAHWWIVATICGTSLGSTIGGIVARSLFQGLYATWIVGWLMGMVLYAGITGACIHWLLGGRWRFEWRQER